ncbi:GntR family transcriptional regulator [Roseibium sp.]|uniref:GntR family transcriptional regulator n=1 Tax=Roseibium sp. TaxID=1936156 RepID=UPI003D0E9CC2
MTLIQTKPSLAQQVYEAIADEIYNGVLQAGAHLVQEQLAERFGVSRQPVQQAMALLKADGMVMEIGRRGLQVIPLDLDLMRHHYEIRAVLDGLAARLAAQRARTDDAVASFFDERGRQIIREGRAVGSGGAVGDQVRHDLTFHQLIYKGSGNPLVSDTVEPHWRFLRRAMGEVLRHAELPHEIWRQHEDILERIVAGDPVQAEALSIDHALRAAETLQAALAGQTGGAASEKS